MARASNARTSSIPLLQLQKPKNHSVVACLAAASLRLHFRVVYVAIVDVFVASSTACIEIGVVLWLVACNSIKLYDYCYIISVCIGKLESIFRSPPRPFAWSFRAIFFAADFVVRFAFRRQSARPLISILWVRYSNRTQSPLSISRLINQNGWLAGIGLP